MDIFDILQEREINELRQEFLRLQREHDTARWDLHKVKDVAEENLELKLRLSVLVRLLIAKGAFTAEEYARLIAAARARAE